MLLNQIVLYIALIAGSAVSETNQGDWRFITIDEDLNQHFVDPTSIKSERGNIRSAWLRYEFENPPTHQPKLRAIQAFENFDCDRRRRQLLLVWAFLSDGERVVEDKVRPWRDVTAGSSSELEFEFVCSGSLAPSP